MSTGGPAETELRTRIERALEVYAEEVRAAVAEYVHKRTTDALQRELGRKPELAAPRFPA